jgi:hypothetical protein
MKTKDIIINEYHLDGKPDFMDKERLAVELCCSKDYIEKLMRDKTLKIDHHYMRRGRFVRFFYPAVLQIFKPANLSMEVQ